MNRERLAWTVSTLMLALLAFQLPGTFAARDDDYSFVRTLVDIHRQVVNNYVEDVNQDELREKAIEGMLSELDPFSVYVPPARQEEFDRMLEGSFKGVGIQLNQLPDGRIEVVSPIDGSPAFKAGVMAGDIITKVNGESIEGLRLPEVIKRVGGPLNTEVTLTVRREDGETADLTMQRQEIVIPVVKGHGRQDDNTWDWWISQDPKVAYIRITQFTPDLKEKVEEVLRQLLDEEMKGLILDLRFNPGGRLDEAVGLIDLFLDSGVIVSTKGRNRPERIETATAPGTLPDFPLIVLVNEHSASASEVVAGALMDNHRALVIGERTYGKGSVQELIPLDGDSGELKLTVAYYYLPSGRLVHRKEGAEDWGVQPQIVIPMDTAQQRRALQERYEAELFHRPTTTRGATQPTTMKVQAATQPADPQLQQALTTMIGLLVLKDDRPPVMRPKPPVPATVPARERPQVMPEDEMPSPERPVGPATQPTE